jgi:hypothetical protein
MAVKSLSLILTLLFLLSMFSPHQILAETDTTLPQLEISTPSKQIWNSTVILHGTAIDESGIQKVTVNGIKASGTFTNIHFFWIKKVDLEIGVNTFKIIAYDNSSAHNSLEKEYSVWYYPTTYQGPTIRLVTVDNLPSNNATIRCIINPNGYPTDVYLSYAEEGVGHSPFNSGRGGWCPTLTGTDEITVAFTFSRTDEKNSGTKLQYIFKAENSRGFAYSKVGNITITDPIELPPVPDTTPPDLVVWDADGQINMPYVWVHGQAWDENGVSKVTVNGVAVEGTRSDNWFFWKDRFELNEGKNIINVTAYDGSLNLNSVSVVSDITYQRSGYSGPTIRLIPFENLPIDNAIMRLQFNPNNNDYTQIYRDGYSSSGSSGGQTLGERYSGAENQTLTYVFPQEWLSVGETIHIIYKIRSGSKWSFAEANFTATPPDYVPPRINSVRPKDEETGVSMNPEVAIVFSEHLNIYSITPNIIRVNDQAITGNLIYSPDTHTIFFKPNNPLSLGTDYTITLSGDIEDYDGNKLGQDYQWSFRTVEPVVDRAYCQPGRIDVGGFVTVNYHLQWSNSTPIGGASLNVDGKTYSTNATGWISLTDTSTTSMKKTFPATQFNYRGMTQFQQLVDDPTCLWDIVEIVFENNKRTDLGNPVIVWRGNYKLDGQPFKGTLIYNDTTSKQNAGKYFYEVESISDPEWGIIGFTAEPFSVVYDRVDINLIGPVKHIDVGTAPIISMTSHYEYDSQPFTGEVELTEPPSTTQPAAFKISVKKISDPQYGLTRFKSNEAQVVWDRIKITQSGVSSQTADIGKPITYWCKAVYEYDSTEFDGSMGVLIANSVAMKYVAERQRWEAEITSGEAKQTEVKVDKVEDNKVGLTVLNTADLKDTIVEWKTAGISGYPLEAIIIGLSASIFYIMKKRIERAF